MTALSSAPDTLLYLCRDSIASAATVKKRHLAQLLGRTVAAQCRAAPAGGTMHLNPRLRVRRAREAQFEAHRHRLPFTTGFVSRTTRIPPLWSRTKYSALPTGCLRRLSSTNNSLAKRRRLSASSKSVGGSRRSRSATYSGDTLTTSPLRQSCPE